MTVIGIVGSRSFNDYNLMTDVINKLTLENSNNLKIISGGANGTDSIAVYIASMMGILTEEIKPDFSKGYDVRQYHFRNNRIIEKSDKIIVFWDGKSKGTKSVIDKCKIRNKPIEVINF